MLANNVGIVPLNGADLNSVAALYHANWHDTHAPLQDARIARSRDLAFFKSRLQRWQKDTLVACVGSKIVGFASWGAQP